MTGIPWREKFDCVAALRCTSCADRAKSMDEELARVGLKPDIVVWSLPDDVVERSARRTMRCVPLVTKAGYASNTFGHYRLMRAAYDLGARRVLVVEDDVRFLSDLDRLAEIVGNLPDVAITMFDLLADGSPKPTYAEIRRMLETSAAGGWAVPQAHPCSTSCIGLTRSGMETFLAPLCKAFSGAGRFDVIDGYNQAPYRPASEVRCAWPLAAVQVPFDRSRSCTAAVFGDDCQGLWYRSLGLSMDDYGGAR